MSLLNVLGTYKLVNSITIHPDKKCVSCPLFEESISWCRYYKEKINDWHLHKDCRVKAITIDE